MTYRPIVIDRRTVPAASLPKLTAARASWVEVRRSMGLSARAVDLLTEPEHSPKARKNSIPTYLLHLAPAANSGTVEVCPASTAGCRAACLYTAGRGKFDTVRNGRIARTRFLGVDPAAFIRILTAEVDRRTRRHGGAVAFRLNATSDIRWETFAPYVISERPDTLFYDYTKHPRRVVGPNYALTYSVSERDTRESIERAMERYGRVAVVVDTPAPRGTAAKLPLPATWNGWPAVDGDEHDLRLEPAGTVVLLRAKGDAIHDQTGFVRPTYC